MFAGLATALVEVHVVAAQDGGSDGNSMQRTGHPALARACSALTTTGQARPGSQLILRGGKRRLEAVRRTG
jgi:hypothetical protein